MSGICGSPSLVYIVEVNTDSGPPQHTFRKIASLHICRNEGISHPAVVLCSIVQMSSSIPDKTGNGSSNLMKRGNTHGNPEYKEIESVQFQRVFVFVDHLYSSRQPELLNKLSCKFKYLQK